MAIEDLRRRDILSFLEDVAEDHPVLSKRLHAFLSSMLNYRLDNDYIEVNPMHRLKKKGVEKSAKNAKDHPVPLSAFAMEVLEELRDETGKTPFVFASPRNRSEEPQPVEWLFKSWSGSGNCPGSKTSRFMTCGGRWHQILQNSVQVIL